MLQSMGSSSPARAVRQLPGGVLLLGALLLGACWEPAVRDVFATGSGDWSGPVGDVGDACIPEDDDFPSFSGFSEGEVSISTEDARCSSGTCLVNHIRGRASCPEGNLDGGECFTPSGDLVTVSVEPHLPERPVDEAVHCSCRCDGPGQFGPFCKCPGGMTCTDFISTGDDLVDLGQGSYCTWL
jgi:hypothetical protein